MKSLQLAVIEEQKQLGTLAFQKLFRNIPSSVNATSFGNKMFDKHECHTFSPIHCSRAVT